jgi:hypothetical protein
MHGNTIETGKGKARRVTLITMSFPSENCFVDNVSLSDLPPDGMSELLRMRLGRQWAMNQSHQLQSLRY